MSNKKKTAKAPAQATLPTSPAKRRTTADETITPEIAKEILSNNKRNRALSVKARDALAAAMLGGRWRDTADTIKIGEDGTLLDGQHRLEALVKAGVTLVMSVARNVTMDARDAIDNGGAGSRIVRDVLAIADGTKVNRHTEAALTVAFGQTENGTTLVGGRNSVQRMRDAIAQHLPSITAVMEALGGKHDKLSCSAVVGTLAICHRIAPNDTLLFARSLRTGAGLQKGDPALTLRDHVMTAKLGGATEREDIALRTFAAFDAYECALKRTFLRVAPATRESYIEKWRKAATREGDGR